MDIDWKELWQNVLLGKIEIDKSEAYGSLEEKYSEVLLKYALDITNPWPPIDFKSCTIDQQLWVRRLAFFAAREAELKMYDRMFKIYGDKDVAEAVAEKALGSFPRYLNFLNQRGNVENKTPIVDTVTSVPEKAAISLARLMYLALPNHSSDHDHSSQFNPILGKHIMSISKYTRG